MSLFAELKRRNVLRVAIAYTAAAWMLIQVADIVFPRLGLSETAVTNTILLLTIGFIPTIVIAWFFELTPEGLKRDSDVSPGESIAPRTSKTLDRLIVVMLVLAVGFLAVDKFVLDPARDQQDIEAATEKGRTEAILGAYGDKSIAVLAFRDMSPAKDQEYFSDGIAEELLNVLARIRELRVISRSSAFSFKGSKLTLMEIGEKLKVSYILEGSVRKAGDQIRVTAQLIDARTDTHVWSQTYDRELDDVFAIQDEISASIVEQLRITLLQDIPAVVRIDPAAYEKYLKAKFIVHSSDGPRLREAQVLLNEILEAEPDYIPAINALSRLYYRIPQTEGMSAEENIAEIHLLGDRVIALAPGSIHALIWQGWFAFTRGDRQAAAGYYEKALLVDPNSTSLLRVVIVLLNSIDRPREAIALGKYLQLRDPMCQVCVLNLARAYSLTGRFEEAALEVQTVLSWHEPNDYVYWYIGRYWLFAGQPGKALKALDACQKESGDGFSCERGIILALHDLGRRDEFEVRFKTLLSDDSHTSLVAGIYAWIGMNDEAFDWLDKIIAQDGPESIRRTRSELFKNLKSDPRWPAFADKHGYRQRNSEAIEFNFELPPGVTLD